MTMRRPQKNGGTEVETFFLGVARDARAGWQQLGGGTEAIAECPQLLAWRQTSLPPRWAARFNTRGWRLGFGCRDIVIYRDLHRV